MQLRKAKNEEILTIWKIIEQAILQRKLDGSNQWQNGYPNLHTIENDLKKGFAYVLLENEQIIAYAAIQSDEEPAYSAIDGQWLSDGYYTVVHRVAIENAYKGKGIATKLFTMIEELSIANQVFSIKVDTNFDNIPMLKILEKLKYVYCGKIYYDGAPRKAFEKLLK